MFFQHRALTLAKDRRRPKENQDAFAVDAVRGIAAIADGVSSTLFARRWAQLLVDAVVAGPPLITDTAEFSACLAEQRIAWQGQANESKLAWHQKPKLAQGAASTLLWVEMAPMDSPGEFDLRCLAVGDCCLFHVQEGRVRRAFPIEDSRGYDIDPQVISSVSDAKRNSIQFRTLADTCEAGDLIVLCTDAIAVWALRELEASRSPEWESFWAMSADDWCAKIEKLRSENHIRYDDTTLVLLRVEDSRGAEQPSDLMSDLKRTVERLTSWLRRPPA